MNGIHTRVVSKDEETLIFSFLYLAARMPEENEPIQKAVSDSFHQKYWRDWGRPGDFGLVSIDTTSQIPIACAWLRTFSKVRGICLNVRDDNPSRKLYRRLGFQDVPGSEMKNRIGTVSRNMLLKLPINPEY